MNVWSSLEVKDIAAIRQLYEELCPTIHGAFHTNTPVLQILAIGKKLRFEYLQTLIDMYHCWRTERRAKNPNRRYMVCLCLFYRSILKSDCVSN